jgi:NSS family neurotransmitter:Na+ symporter
MGLEMLLLGILNCLGFNILGSVSIAGMGILDFFDFTTNSIMMPVSATMICLLVLRKITVARIEEEVTFGGSSAFRLRGVYRFVVKYIAIAFLIVILISSVLNVLGIIHI